MLTRNNQVAPQQEYYSDSLLSLPSMKQSVFHNLSIGFATPIVALNMLDKDFAKKPDGKAILDAFNATQLENETPGMSWGQWLTGQGSNMLGFGLNPVTWFGGEAGGLAAKGITAGAQRIAPDALSVFARAPIKSLVAEPIGRYIPEKIGQERATLSTGLMAEETLKNFGIFAGAGVPQGIVDNYKADTGHIEWGGVAREAGEMGAFGMAIGSIPFAWGILRGKVNRGLGKSPTDAVDTASINMALEKGHITKEEHDWYIDYLEHQKNPGDVDAAEKLKSRATDLINKNGHRANTISNEAMFDILTPNDVTNLHGVIADQLASGHLPEEQRLALSDFIVHNRMDFIRQKPEWLDGVRGYVDFVTKKLEDRLTKTEEADKILERHLLKSVKDNMPFSQKELLKHMKKASFESSHIQHLPVTIPESMVKHLKLQDKINKLKVKLNKQKRRGEEPNKQTIRRIEELEASLPKILTPKEELSYLREQLLGKGLKQGFERSNAYHRLLDLSNVWHNARTLLDSVHLEHEYNRQSAFKDVASHILRIADSDMGEIAKPENVMDYMRNRIEGQINKLEPIQELNAEVDAKMKVPADSDEILNEQELQVKETKAEEAKQDFMQSSDKFKEFKNSEKIFKNLISCVMGGLGG